MADSSITVTDVPDRVREPFKATFNVPEGARPLVRESRSWFGRGALQPRELLLSDIKLENATASDLSGEGETYMALITPINPGTVTVSVEFPANGIESWRTEQSNATVKPASTTYIPRLPLTLTISGVPPKATGPFLARFVFSEAVTSFSAGALALTNATVSNIQGSGTTYTARITPDYKGKGQIKVRGNAVLSSAGLGNLEAVATFDVFSALTISGVRETAHDPFTVALTFASSVTGFGANMLTVEKATVSDFKGSGATYTALITPTAPATAQAVPPVKVSVAEAAVTSAGGLANRAASMSFLPIMPAGRPLFPLQLRMLDGAGQAILALDDGKPHTLVLEVQNNDTGDVTLSPLPPGVTSASKTNWHFRLLIRQAVLSASMAAAYKTAQSVNGWSIQAEPAPDRLDWMAFYLACTSATGNPLAAGKAVRLPLSLAAPRGIGARGTKVELETNTTLVKSGDTGLDVRLSHHLLIADAAEARAAVRAGQFSVRTSGTHGNRVLCDGKTENEITLTIKPRPEALADLNGQTWSNFRVQIKAPNDLTIPANGVTATGLVKSTQDGALEFSLQSQSQTFTSETAWTITLKKVTSSGIQATAPGPTAITVTLKNIPLAGGIDEVQDVVIEKTRIMLGDSGNVGIGTTTPKWPITVHSGRLVLDHPEDGYASLDFARAGNRVFGMGMVPQSNDFHVYRVSGTEGNTDAADVLTIASDGNVGIGTAKPTAKLDVRGPVQIWADMNQDFRFRAYSDNGKVCAQLFAYQNFSGYVGTLTQHPFTIRTGDLDRMTVDVAGNVGVGTINPNAKLDVRGSVHIGRVLEQNSYFSAWSSDGNICTDLFSINNNGGYVGTSTAHPFTIKTGRSDRITIDAQGNVGIGTTRPARGALHVVGTQNFKPGSLHKFFESNNEGGGVTPDKPYGYSIWADGFVGTSKGFHVESDARIKELVAHSDGNADLKRLSAIEIVDYRYRDTVQFGRAVHKKVFAQQVEAVLPEAVNRSKGVVPDIMARARAQDGWIALETDLAPGERVKILMDETVNVFDVLETRPGGFRIDLETESADVFVYGREVEDLRVVDYDAIAMLNVSATQELARQMQAKDARISALEAQVADAENAIENLAIAMRDMMGELAALKKQTSTDRR